MGATCSRKSKRASHVSRTQNQNLDNSCIRVLKKINTGSGANIDENNYQTGEICCLEDIQKLQKEQNKLRYSHKALRRQQNKLEQQIRNHLVDQHEKTEFQSSQKEREKDPEQVELSRKAQFVQYILNEATVHHPLAVKQDKPIVLHVDVLNIKTEYNCVVPPKPPHHPGHAFEISAGKNDAAYRLRNMKNINGRPPIHPNSAFTKTGTNPKTSTLRIKIQSIKIDSPPPLTKFPKFSQTSPLTDSELQSKKKARSNLSSYVEPDSFTPPPTPPRKIAPFPDIRIRLPGPLPPPPVSPPKQKKTLRLASSANSEHPENCSKRKSTPHHFLTQTQFVDKEQIVPETKANTKHIKY